MLSPGACVLGVLSVGVPGADLGAATREPLSLRVNGVELALQSRVLDGEAGDLARRLEGRWGARLPDVPSDGGAAATRWLLGRQRGAFHETLTLSAGPRVGTALVVVAVQDLRRTPAAAARPPMTLPAGASVLNVVEFGRAPGAPSVFTLEIRADAETAIAALAASARASGWRPTTASVSASRALWARRGRDELTAVAVGGASRTRLVLLVAPAAGVLPR